MKDVFIKKGEAKFLKKVDGKTFRMLVRSKGMRATISEMEVGALSELYHHKGEEIHIMLKGKVEYQVGDHSYIMEEGDVLWHHSDVPHRAKNIGSEKAVYMTVGIPPETM